DGGGCLPEFDADGVLTRMDVGDPATLSRALTTLLAGGADLDRTVAAFTRNPATLLRLHRKGRIEPGCDADLVVLNERFEVDSVLLGGVWQKRNGRQLVTGPFETAAAAE
ncbi:MAG: amidohydrolase family protein, partial [Pseudomonadota bacterium]